MNLKYNEEEILFLINNIVFPYKLPGEYESLDESKLLSIVINGLNAISTFDCVKESIEIHDKVLRMLNKWFKIQESTCLSGKDISELIKKLKKNEAAPLYLKSQNACLIFKKTINDKCLISGFQASANNNAVMSAKSDLITTLPVFTYNIDNTDILYSECFASQLADIANNEISYAKSKKAGIETDEIRDVPNSNLALEWIPLLLISAGTNGCVEDAQKIVKKIRDDVVHSNKLLPFRRSGFWFSIKAVLQLSLCELYGDEKGKIIYKIVIALIINELCNHSIEYKLPLDLISQIIKKLSRRLYKIDLLDQIISQ